MTKTTMTAAELRRHATDLAQLIDTPAAGELIERLADDHGLRLSKRAGVHVASMGGLKGRSATGQAEALQNWGNRARRELLRMEG